MNKKLLTTFSLFLVGITSPIKVSALGSIQVLADTDCGIFGDLLQKGGVISDLFFFIQAMAILAAIVLGMVDYFTAMTSGDQDSLKKASKKFVNRIIIAVIIVILPVLIDFMINTFLGGFADSCINSL